MKTSSSWLKALVLSCALLPAVPGLAASLQAPGTPDFTAAAEDQPGRPRGNGEVRAYVQQNVLPVVRQQRQKLEAQLSAADKTQLTGYRAQLKALREQGKALRQTLRPAQGSPAGQRPALTEAQQQQLRQLRTERRAILQQVAQLATKYEAQLTQLKGEVQPQRKQWAADIRNLVQKQLSPEQRQRLEQHRAQAGGQHGHHGKGHRGALKHNYFGPVRFLLLDPNAPAPAAAADRSAPAAMYPNPAGSTQRLDYQVKKEGNVKVELLDERGKALRTVLNDKQPAGSHSLDVNLSDLPRGTYYYKISSKGQSETRRFVKE